MSYEQAHAEATRFLAEFGETSMPISSKLTYDGQGRSVWRFGWQQDDTHNDVRGGDIILDLDARYGLLSGFYFERY